MHAHPLEFLATKGLSHTYTTYVESYVSAEVKDSQEPVLPRIFDPVRDADLLSLYDTFKVIPSPEIVPEDDEFYRMPGYRSPPGR